MHHEIYIIIDRKTTNCSIKWGSSSKPDKTMHCVDVTELAGESQLFTIWLQTEVEFSATNEVSTQTCTCLTNRFEGSHPSRLKAAYDAFDKQTLVLPLHTWAWSSSHYGLESLDVRKGMCAVSKVQHKPTADRWNSICPCIAISPDHTIITLEISKQHTGYFQDLNKKLTLQSNFVLAMLDQLFPKLINNACIMNGSFVSDKATSLHILHEVTSSINQPVARYILVIYFMISTFCTWQIIIIQQA